MLGYSAADIEATLLLAQENASKRENAEVKVTDEDLQNAVNDYFPSRNETMLRYMELLAVFESSNRKYLPEKYAEISQEELQRQLDALALLIGNRR